MDLGQNKTLTRAHTGENGFFVVTTEEAADYLGYPALHFGSNGFMIGRWSGIRTESVFGTLAEAIGAEGLVPDQTVPRGNPSNALERHLAALENND